MSVTRNMEEAVQGTWTAYPWRKVEAPRDRAIWVSANVISRDDFSTAVDHYEGYAKWHEATQDWLDLRGMSIRQEFHAEFRVLSWIELRERAANCLEIETDTSANVYYWGNQGGFFAGTLVYHIPTGVRVWESDYQGPFATRTLAVAALVALLQTPLTALANPEAATAAGARS